MQKPIIAYKYAVSIDDNRMPFVMVPPHELFKCAEEFMLDVAEDHVPKEHKEAVIKYIDTLQQITTPRHE